VTAIPQYPQLLQLLQQFMKNPIISTFFAVAGGPVSESIPGIYTN
jgi:hypothetical protein